MCGIAGIFGLYGKPVELREVQSMCAAIINRGPDDAGYYVKDDIGLGMRRLSIIDLDTGQQPIANEDGSVQVVLNGEIYNYRELRQELIARGHSFRSCSDTEVIAHLYEEYGSDCVQHLRGMFAFAVWDDANKRLMLARDRLGIKPLYYGVVDGRLVFASELKSILQLQQVERQLNWNAVGHLFGFLSTPSDQSVVADVQKLPPAYVLIASRCRSVAIHRYWDVNFTPDYGHSSDYFVESLQGLLEESVRLRMISDVPLGAFLSGGLDSSAVVATMARQVSGPLKTFSIGFTEQDFNEADHARTVASAFGTDHHELVLEPDVIGLLDDLAWHLDEPFGDSSAIPTYMVSRLAARHVKVVLSGDGGDELFAGYSKYRVEQRERNYRYIPFMIRQLLGLLGEQMQEGMKGRNFLRHIALNGTDRYLDANSMFRRSEQQALFEAGAAERILAQDPWKERARFLHSQDGHWLSRIQHYDLKHYLPLDILTKVDRMSMANSLEARVPLLDHKLVEFAATIPAELQMRGGESKYIFKQAMRGILPDHIVDRPKQGFAVPLGRWFRGELDDYVRGILLSDASRARGIFNPAYIEKLISLQASGRPLDLQLWTLLSFELWCRRFLDTPAVVESRAEDSIQTRDDQAIQAVQL